MIAIAAVTAGAGYARWMRHPTPRGRLLLVLAALLVAVLGPADSARSSPSIVEAARAQVGITTVYDPAYVRLDYPGGDVPRDRGVCTDVIIRALRDALGLDLQARIHVDMRQHFSAYPDRWGARRPDRNIDHRRVPNLRRYFERQGWSLPVNRRPEDYRPGDLVTSTVPRHRPHVMVVSDRRAPSGVPLVIHNIGNGTREEDRLFAYPITGHYRVPDAARRPGPKPSPPVRVPRAGDP